MPDTQDEEKDHDPMLDLEAYDLETTTECRKQRTNQYWQSVKLPARRLGLALLPSPIRKCVQPEKQFSCPSDRTTTSYLDGLRGIAAIIVFIEHFCHPYQSTFLTPYGERGNWSWMQLPFVSLIYSGSPMVMLFFVISGFSLSLRPLQHIKRADSSGALGSLASATFKRAFRLLLPCIVSTFFVMLAVQLGTYNTVYECASPLLDLDPPPTRLTNLGVQFIDWVAWVLTRLIYPWKWFREHPTQVTNEYSFQLWTIGAELYGSYVLFLVLLSQSKIRPRLRLVNSIVMMCFCMWSHIWDVPLFISGMLLAEAHLEREASMKPFSQRDSLLMKLLQYTVLAVGLYFMSLPDFFTSASPVYGWMTMIWTRPQEWQSLGAILVVFVLDRRQGLQTLFTLPILQYVGQVSYALYIVHVPMLQIFGWALVPIMWSVTGTTTQWQYQLGFLLALVVFVPILLWVSDIFWRAVDKTSVRLARRLERKVFIA